MPRTIDATGSAPRPSDMKIPIITVLIPIANLKPFSKFCDCLDGPGCMMSMFTGAFLAPGLATSSPWNPANACDITTYVIEKRGLSQDEKLFQKRHNELVICSDEETLLVHRSPQVMSQTSQ